MSTKIGKAGSTSFTGTIRSEPTPSFSVAGRLVTPRVPRRSRACGHERCRRRADRVRRQRCRADWIPAAFAQEAKKDAARRAPKGPQPLEFPGKDANLIVLGDKPLVAETPEHLLDDDTTPTAKFFIRNNGQIPEAAKEPDAWKLTIDGEVNKPLELTLGEMKKRFKARTLSHGAGMRRQRPIVFHAAGARQPMDQRRRRLRRMDRRASAEVLKTAG